VRAALLVPLFAGCVETQHLDKPEVDSSHVEVREIPETRLPKLDVLIVIDDAPGLAAYRDRIAEIPALITDAIDRGGAGWTDLHIGVTFNDGRMQRLPGAAESFLTRSIDFAYTRDQDFEGTLPDALARLITTDYTYGGPTQPLAAMEHALETSGQFVRSDADLAVVMISATDDASPLGVAEYARWIRALVGMQWHKHVFVSGLYAQPAPRLDELFTNLRATGTGMSTSIDASDYGAALVSLRSVTGWGGVPCLDAAPLDADPESAGKQYDCSLSVLVDDELRTVPGCDGGSASDGAQMPGPPCFALASDAQNCITGDHLVLKLHGYTESVHPAYRFECLMR